MLKKGNWLLNKVFIIQCVLRHQIWILVTIFKVRKFCTVLRELQNFHWVMGFNGTFLHTCVVNIYMYYCWYDHLIINNQQKITINLKLKLATFSLISNGLSIKSQISFHVCHLLNCLFNSRKHLATYSYIQLVSHLTYIFVNKQKTCSVL